MSDATVADGLLLISGIRTVGYRRLDLVQPVLALCDAEWHCMTHVTPILPARLRFDSGANGDALLARPVLLAQRLQVHGVGV